MIISKKNPHKIHLNYKTTVLKPGPAPRVDPGPGRPGPGTGPGVGKNLLGRWPSKTRSTRDPGHPVKPG